MHDPQTIPDILRNAKVIAIVGISDKPDRPSYEVATYLLEHGYTIIPINPNLKEWKGIKAYPSLVEIEKSDSGETQKIDVVDIFRKSEDVLSIVEEAVDLGPEEVGAIWMQLGIKNDEAAELAKKANIPLVMDKCMKIEHQKLKIPKKANKKKK